MKMGHEAKGHRRRAALALLALSLISLFFVPTALAAGPFHAREKALDVSGLNKACAAAVDSKGDLYAASAGEGKIKIFSPTDHKTPIGEIANPNEPCGLAVDSKGNLYASEQATGNVVRYHPTSYPFSGAPSYGAPTTVDSSGQAQGISVDPVDDRLYVAEGNRVSIYNSGGELGINEMQRINCFLCTGGSYKLIFKGEETEAIPYSGTAKEVEEKLEKLAALDPADVSVLNGATEKDHRVTFEGKYAHTDVESLTANASIEGGGEQKLEITEFTKSWSGHVGEGELTDATGVAAYTYVPGGENKTRYLLITDPATDEALTFSGPSVDTLKHRRTIEGPKSGEDFEFGAAGSAVAADPETGHFFHRRLLDLRGAIKNGVRKNLPPPMPA